jgi:sec-independent protein translocase protein TatC
VSSQTPKHGHQTFGQRFRERGLIGALGGKKNIKADPNKMHFLEHLEEMRWVIFKSVIAFLAGCMGVAVFLDDSVRLLQRPLVSAVQDFGNLSIDLQAAGLQEYQPELESQGITLKDLIDAEDEDLQNWGINNPQHRLRLLIHFSGGKDRNLLQVIRSYSPIFIAMKICFLGGLGLSLPFILFFVGSFVTPGLTFKEKKVFFPGCLAATVLFLAGSGMTYFFILPLSLAFTIDFSFNVLGLENYRPEAGNYYSTVIWMTFAVGLAFQFPLILILLIRIGLLTVSKLRRSRRFVLVILMISAALITPGGDPVSLCILTIPLYFLFELSILVGTLIEKKIDTGDENSQETGGITGSITLLVLLLALGGGGAWLYLNWNEAKSFLGSFPIGGDSGNSLSPAKQNLTKGPDLPLVRTKDEFILELTPINNPMDINRTNSSQSLIYRARIKP